MIICERYGRVCPRKLISAQRQFDLTEVGMDALFDRYGTVHAWLDAERGHILDLRGQNIAFLDRDDVYDWKGRHVGWWIDGCVRDEANAVAYFTTHAVNLGVIKPVEHMRPVQPIKAVAPARPVEAVTPVRPMRRANWSRQPPF